MILRLKHAQQEIKKKQADLKKTEQGYQKDKSAYDDVQKNLKALEVGTFVRKTKCRKKQERYRGTLGKNIRKKKLPVHGFICMCRGRGIVKNYCM